MRAQSDNSTLSALNANAGVVLSFDDYSDTWIEHLPLLEALGIKATFFVTGNFLRDSRQAEARLRPLLESGHSLGVHTFSHRRATEMWESRGLDWLQSEVLEQSRILGQLSGQPIIAFAYPYGDRNDITDQTLAPHFHVLRAFGKRSIFTTQQRLRKGGVIHATSIDNTQAYDPSWYDDQLRAACRQSRFWVVASHHINDTKWGITPERLTQFAESARRFGLKIFRFDDFLE